MTTYNKATLKTFFQQGDVPTGTDYANLIDSQVNLVETAEQSMAGNLVTTKLITPRVSADAISTSIFSVSADQSIVMDTKNAFSLDASGSIAVSAGSALNITAGSNVDVSAAATVFLTGGSDVTIQAFGTINLLGSVSMTGDAAVSALTVNTKLKGGVSIVSAAGTTQATAAALTAVINRGKGVVDGSTTGYRCVSNQAGAIQYLFNEGASANLWPPTGGTINGLAANAPLPLVASAGVTIVHLTASAMMAK